MDRKVGFTFDAYTDPRGVPVVHIETTRLSENTRGPRCRVYLNDGVLYENPPFDQEGDGKMFDRLLEAAGCMTWQDEHALLAQALAMLGHDDLEKLHDKYAKED